MLFANGDRAITGQLNRDVIVNLENEFLKDKSLIQSDHIEGVSFTKDTITVFYDPIQVLENENTIEPSLYIMSRLEPVLNSDSEVSQMSVIIKDSGLLTILQTVSKTITEDNNDYNGAVDNLSPRLANKLVGNDVYEPTIEMSGQPGAIQFTEPTIFAYSGGDFRGTINDETVENNRIYHANRGDILSFGESNRGCRVYIAVAGGLAIEKSNVLKSGDEVIMRRDYTSLHDEIFHMMMNKRKVSWGIGVYSIVEVYLSDTYHLVKRPDVPNEVYE